MYGEGITDNTDITVPVTQRFTFRETFVNKHVKVLARLEDVVQVYCAHFAVLRNDEGSVQRDTNGRVFQGPFNHDGPSDVAYINHYYFKSTREYSKKYLSTGADGESKDTRWGDHPTRNATEDTWACDFYKGVKGIESIESIESIQNIDTTLNKSDIIVYVACHNDTAEASARNQMTDPYYRFVRISDSSPFFESQIFGILARPEYVREWFDKSWVGIVTYSFNQKMGGGSFDFENAMNKVPGGTDVVSLLNLDFSKPRVGRPVSFVESVSMQHGPFLWMAIYNILKLIGYKESEIMDKNITGFFSNWWLARPTWMIKYIAFCKKCIDICEKHPVVKSYLQEDAYYIGRKVVGRDELDKEFLVRTFGKPYYTLQPFIFERLPCFFFGIEGAKVYRGIGQRLDWHLLD
jgi:hypothetical protein